MEALELSKWTEMGDVARHVGFPGKYPIVS